MAFPSYQDASQRLMSPSPLSRHEIADLFPWIHVLSEADMRNLRSHLALGAMIAIDENRRALEAFERASARLTRWLVGLTAALLVLTMVIAGFTNLLWLRG